MQKVVGLGFEIAKPYGDSECYDFILEPGEESRGRQRGRFWRVQVKSTNRLRKGGYVVGACHFASRGTKQSYTAADIDILAVYIVPEKAWYVIPVEEFAPRKYLSFFPQNVRSRGRFERFREAWHLMSAAGVVS